MNQFIAYSGIGIIIIGSFAILFYLGKKIYKVQMQPVKAEPKKSIPTKQLEIPWSQLSSSGKLGRITQYILGYWFIFVIALTLISKAGNENTSSEQMNDIMIAPFVLPFMWAWKLLNNKTFGYVIAFIFIAWIVQKELSRLHDKLDQILEELEER